MHGFALAAVVVASLTTSSIPENEAAKLFADTCSACHTIGGGDLAGPDLVRVKRWPAEDVRKAVLRMQENVGTLKPEQVEGLVHFLKETDAEAHLVEANAPPAEPPPEQKGASAATGRRLFFGEQPLANGGAPCFGCHTVAGRGGNLAIDLTTAFVRRGEIALVSSVEKPGFPLMKAAYAGHAVTPQEAWHIAAFLKESAKVPPVKAPREGVHPAAAAIALVVLGGVAVVFRPRKRR
jgi:hypothetical protein